MSKQKQKGSSFEQQVVDYLSTVLDDDRIERRTTSGKNDRGDISGIRIHGERVVIECKNHAKMELSQWLDEAEVERGNDDAGFAFVVHKRKGRGDKRMGETYATCTLETLAALIAGNREVLGGDDE